MISIALNLISLTLPASSRESLKAQRRKHIEIIFILGKSSELKRRLGEAEKTIQPLRTGRPFLEGFGKLLKKAESSK